MTSVRRNQFRTSREPRLATPLGARSVGYYEFGPNQRIDRAAVKPFVELSWCQAGTILFGGGRGVVQVTANQVFVYPSGSTQSASSGREGARYFWYTMDGPLADAMVASFGLAGSSPKDAGPPPVDLFDRLTGELQDVSLPAEVAAAQTAFAILSRAAHGCQLSAAELEFPGEADARDQMSRRLADPDFSIRGLAREMGVHRSLLSRRFRRAHGMPPKKYLMSLRMQRAMSLLLDSDNLVRDIAYQSGFADPNYFARAFRRETGQSPEQFRQNWRR
ncbi:MAG: HTH-type transcriptional activator RhaR [Phycisphaerae bacterium]|nr:HTH-type transcriptional activator RhaR [Phycisphaerae bacterium]